MTEDLHVVLGATGGTGSAVVRELARQGARVRAVSRHLGAEAAVPGVERRAADVTAPDGLRAALESATVVYHTAQPPYHRWREEFPAMTVAVADAARSVGAKLVFADNLYMYGPIAGPIAETSPQHPASVKGAVRKAMADDLLFRHAVGDLRVTIGRSSDYFGPEALGSAIGEQLFSAAVAGRKARWLGDPDVPHTEHFIDDIARGLVTLGMRSEADGEVWHLPAAAPLTGRAFLHTVFETAGQDARIAPTSVTMMRVAGVFSPLIRASVEMMYQWEQPFTIDPAKFEAAFGPMPPTPHAVAIERTVAWFRERALRSGA
jgi:nucleoside-diphosphate-sugar epimerase